MIINQSNLHGLTTGYSAAFNKALSEVSPDYKDIATVTTSTTAANDYAWLGQIPGMREWIGDREIQHISEYGYTIKNKDFERTLGIKRTAIEDDQYGIYAPMFSAMGQEAGEHYNDLVFGLLTKGFTEKCYDEKTFFAADHKSGDKTFSNTSTAALSRESFLAARQAMMSITGDKDKPLKLVPDLLVVSPKNEMAAKEILEASIIDGSTNITQNLAKVKVATELAGENEDAWFLLCTKKFLKPIILQIREKIKFSMLTKSTDYNVFMQNEFLYGCDGRDNAGFGFWQMAYGSTGKTAGLG
mgnify:CR=1 FL=1